MWPSTIRTIHFHSFGPSILDLTLKSDQKWPLSLVLRSTKPYSHFRRFSYSSLFVFELGQVLRDLLLYKKYIQLSLQKSGLNPTWSSEAHLETRTVVKNKIGLIITLTIYQIQTFNFCQKWPESLFFYIKGVPICALKWTKPMLQARRRSVFWPKLNPFNALECLVRTMH